MKTQKRQAVGTRAPHMKMNTGHRWTSPLPTEMTILEIYAQQPNPRLAPQQVDI